MKFRYWLSSVAGIALVGTASSADAQAPDANAGATGLAEVIVTAQKRSEDLQSTPIAITSISGKQLEQMGVTNITDLGPSLPNVVISSAAGLGGQAASFFIRGVGLDRNTLAQEAGVGLYIDDVYYARSPGALLSLLDVKSIEVLRGPQGTLFGKNTIGGAIRYTTNDPGFDNAGYIDLKAGQRDHMDVRGSFNYAVNDTLAIKISAGSFNSGGYVHDIPSNVELGNDHTNVGRVATLWRPTDRLSVTASADYTSSTSNGPPISTTTINPLSGVAALWNTLNPTQPYDNRYATSLYNSNDNTNPFHLEGVGLNLNAAYTVNDALTLKSISGYRRNTVNYYYDFDGSPIHIYETAAHDRLPMFSQEFQAVGDTWAHRLQYLAGLYYFRETPSEQTQNSLFLYPPGDHTLEHLTSQSYAAFGQATVEIVSGLKLTAGGRYTKDKKTQSVDDPLRKLAGTGTETWTDFAPKAVLQYQWTPSVMTYVSASKGYRSGGFNDALTPAAINNGIVAFAPETAWNYELGAKTQMFDDRVRLNGALFQMNYTNLQLTVPVGQPAALLVGNAGKARIRGAELDGAVLPFTGLTLEGSFGRLDAQYLEAPVTSGVVPGSQFAGTPRTSYSVAATYTHDVANHGELAFHADYGYKSTVKTYASDIVADYLPPVGLLNGEIRFTTSNELTSFAVQGHNITNKHYITNGLNFTAPFPGLIGGNIVTVGRPAEFYFTISRKF